MCNCKKKPEPPAVIPPIESVHSMDNIDEFFIPDTPDGLLARELNKWNEEEHKKLMDQLKDWKDLDKFEDEEEYPLIHD